MDPITSFAVHPSAPEQRRQVVLRACDLCRRKKIRCEPIAQGCAQCNKYGTSCQFSPNVVRRKPRRPTGPKYITQLEERLSKMEKLLGDQLSSDSPVPDGRSSQEQRTRSPSLNTDILIASDNQSHPSMPETLPTILSTNETGSLGSNLRVASLTYDYKEKENDLSTIRKYTMDDLSRNVWLRTTPDLGPISLPSPQQLPTKAVALELVKETFSSYIKFLPLFDEKEFLKEFEVKYEFSNPGDAGWWACINVVLSIAQRLRALRTLDPTKANTQAHDHFQNAMAVVSELIISHNSLPAVQALVGIASILQGTSNPESSSVLIGAALRLAQNMNLHRECSNLGLTASEAEKRRRVFWIAYILDKDISLRMERPFSQDDDDMDVQLPSKTPYETLEHGIESCAVNLLNYRIGLAVIQGQVYKQLYSLQEKRQSEPQRIAAAQELNSSLSYWRSITQPELPEESLALSGRQLTTEMIHKMVLRLTYIHCLAMIDRHLPPMVSSVSHQEPAETEPLLPSESACLIESRKAIRLLEVIPHQDCACVWMLLHAFFAASSSILSAITRNPMSPQAHSDLHLVKPFLHLLQRLNDDQTVSRSEESMRMNRICSSLNIRARDAVQNFGISTTDTIEICL